jgi:hypothetical protein
MKKIYNSGKGENYNNIVPVWLIYSWVKWIGNKKDEMITVEIPPQK